MVTAKSTIYAVCYLFSKDSEEIDDRALQTKRLYARINRLGLVDRGIILFWLEGLSYEEIGAVMGISVKNVSFQLHLIKEELKKSNL